MNSFIYVWVIIPFNRSFFQCSIWKCICCFHDCRQFGFGLLSVFASLKQRLHAAFPERVCLIYHSWMTVGHKHLTIIKSIFIEIVFCFISWNVTDIACFYPPNKAPLKQVIFPWRFIVIWKQWCKDESIQNVKNANKKSVA